MRVGIGYDVHPLTEGRKLILGGIDIPYSRGLIGYSDADVLIHSIGDALLGAAGKRDIGFFFPNTDHQYKGISSLVLLRKIFALLQKERFRVNNLDATIIAQEPRISPYIPQMKEKIAQALEINIKKVGIKATCPEGLGFSGEKKGISCWAIASIESKT